MARWAVQIGYTRYDALDRLEEVRQPFGGAGGGTMTTGYAYDVQDHLVQVTDGEGTVTSYEYSDRDLMTEEVSEVSGTTTYTFNPSGEQLTKTDARGITEIRTYDALDRVTHVDYPAGNSLDIVYTYDDPQVDFSLGRLTSLVRNGHAIDYTYDRFGRTTQDGQLIYGYDRNGNRSTIGYPFGEMATYTFDHADRESTLSLETPGEPDRSIITAAGYYPNGPLEAVTLGNGLTETHEHDTRYFPAGISVESSAPETLLDWSYAVDAVSNPTAIADGLNAANSRTYGFQDYQYFLTQGDGPWGTRAWTYDKIGNRLTETADGGSADTYVYTSNAAGNNSPKLDHIGLGLGGQHTFQYDLAGNQTQANLAGNVIDRTYDAAGRLSAQERTAAEVISTFFYDARGFLRLATGTAPDTSGNTLFCDGFETGGTTNWGGTGTCFATEATTPIYDSSGQIHVRNGELVIYFDDTPVAQGTASGTWLHLTPDHLGTPILATDETGAIAWQGGFEPFGQDYSNATGADVFLRFPGQWEDPAWTASGMGDGVYYNVFRWRSKATSSYLRPDPDRRSSGIQVFSYAARNPLLGTDPLGLRIVVEDDRWIPFVRCATRFGDGTFRKAWDYLMADDDTWEIRTAGEDQPMSKEARNRYFRASDGRGSNTERPGLLLGPGRIWIDARRPLKCTSIVRSIAHEVIEAYVDDSDPRKGGPQAHAFASSVDRSLAQRICVECCALSDGKMQF